MKIYLLLTALFLSLLPLSAELGIEIYRARILNRSDKHVLSATIRVTVQLLMAFCLYKNSGLEWWKSFGLSIAVHYLCFNYIFNNYGFEVPRHWSYLGKNFLDRIQKKINPLSLLFFKIACVIIAIGIILW